MTDKTTAYEPDPTGVLAEGVRVRIEGGAEGVWTPFPASNYHAGAIVVENGWEFPVPRGLEPHLTVLREAIDNRPTEPGRYNVTWAGGAVSPHNPWTLHPDGVWRDSGGISAHDADLRRATYERLPDPKPAWLSDPEPEWQPAPEPEWQPGNAVHDATGRTYLRDEGGFWVDLYGDRMSDSLLVRPLTGPLVPPRPPVEVDVEELADEMCKGRDGEDAARLVLTHLAALGVPVVAKGGGVTPNEAAAFAARILAALPSNDGDDCLGDGWQREVVHADRERVASDLRAIQRAEEGMRESENLAAGLPEGPLDLLANDLHLRFTEARDDGWAGLRRTAALYEVTP